MGFCLRRFLFTAFVGLLACSLRAEEPRIDLHLAFSTDGGKSYSSDFPVLAEPGVVKVRATWSHIRPGGEQDVYTTSMFSEQSDFASANVGRQTWRALPAWYHRPKQYYLGAEANPQFDYELDVRARPEGVIGSNNLWDKDAKKFVPGPLPSLAAMQKGTYRFSVTVGYTLKKTDPNRRVEGIADFMLTIGTAAASLPLEKPVVKNESATSSKSVPLDMQQMDLGESEWTYPVATATGPRGEMPVKAKAGDAASLSAGAELRWILKGIRKGDYYIGVVLSKRASVYADGNPVHLSSTRKPGQLDKDTWMAEHLSADPVRIEEGTELRVVSEGTSTSVGRIALYPQRPERGPVDVAPINFPARSDKVRATASITAGMAQVSVTNVLTRPVQAQMSAKVIDYFQNVVAQEQQDIVLQPRVPLLRKLTFKAGESEQYRIEVVVTATGMDEVSASAEYLSDSRSSHRSKLWLSGTWQFAGMGDDRELRLPPADAKWQAAVVPGRSPNSLAGKEHCGWFRRTFDLPADLPGGKRSMVFDRVNYEARIVVNGQEVGRHMGWQAGFSVDVTDQLKPGANEVMIGVRDAIAALVPEEQAKGQLTGTDKTLWPGANNRAGVGDVYLVSMPGVAVADVAVRPSFRQKKLDLEITLPDAPANATLRNTVYHLDEPVLRFNDLKLPAKGSSVHLSQSWKDPILWGLHQPNLLRLETELLDAQGNRLDLLQTRFGFREFYAEGAHLLLNGQPMNFRAYAMNDDGGMTDRMPRANIRKRIREGKAGLGMIERHIYAWHNHMDVADEEGVPLATAITGEAHPTQHKFENDTFWENARQLAGARVRQLRNHPSIVEWYLSNEFVECAPDPVLAVKRMVSILDVVRAADPTRVCEAGCDLDLRGALDIICTHYPVDISGLRNPAAYLPDSIWWHMPGQALTPGMKVPAGLVKGVANVRGDSPITWGVKPIVVNETGWIYFYRPLNGLTNFMGDEVFRGPESVKRAHEQANAWFMAGHRDAEVSLLTPWRRHDSGMIAATLPPLDIFPKQRGAQWYGGTPVTWDIDLFHDTGVAESLKFNWALENRVSRQSLASGQQQVEFEPYGLRRTQLAFTAPGTNSDVDGQLRLWLTDENGKVRLEKNFPAKIAAAVKWQPKRPVKVGLFDPTGKSQPALQRLGVQSVAVIEPTFNVLAGYDLLIIGENSGTDATLVAHGASLEKFVDAGGRVLCLQQDQVDNSWFPLLSAPVSGQITSIVFPRSEGHPILQGLSSDELRFWFPNHIVARNPYVKPVAGNALTILDCGNATQGLNLAAVMELRHGRGRMIFSQLVFVEQSGQSPQADRLVVNMLDYLSGAAPAEAKPAALWTSANSSLEHTLKRLGADVDYQPALNKLSGYGTVILDRSVVSWDAAARSTLRDYVNNGGVVVCHGFKPEDKPFLQELLLREVRVTTPTPPGFAGRMILNRNDALTTGLSNQDFFWNRHPDGEDPYPCFSAPQYRIDEVLGHAYEAAGAVPLGYPAGLVRLDLGKGTVYLDGTRWDQASGTVTHSADRIAYTMLGNLGVNFRTRKPAVRLTGLDYAPIDIRTHLNRSLVDDVADDGKGGWTDQGPQADLRTLPTGRQTFAGVPFEITTPQSCLVLASKFRPGDAPKAVTGIAIGRPADALYFLHSAAWISPGFHGSYRINYADKTAVEIPLEGGVNYRDWGDRNPERAYAGEIATFSQVAWTGSTPQFPKVSIYAMQWSNPRPEITIASVDFISANNGVPVLLAITAGSRPANAATPKVGDSKRAEALDAQARSAMQAGDKRQAEKSLRDAIVADPTYVPAQVRLADLLESAGDKRQTESILRQVVRIDPENMECYLRIGRLCEEDNRIEGALEIYAEALRVNPNQPLIVQANERLRRK